MILLGGLAIVAVAVGTVAVRTANFAPANLADGSDVTLAAAPAYDLDAAVRHLSAAAQIRTISHQNPTDNERAEWDRLHAWLASTSPAAHAPIPPPPPPPPTLVLPCAGSRPPPAPPTH